MTKRDIVVIGASSGGVEALKSIVSGLQPEFPATVCIVWHMSPEAYGLLPDMLQRVTKLSVSQGKDKEPIERGHIYVAPPDHHLLLEDDHLRVTRGPKENRFRPAIDPLFRSAAFSFGARVIGVILSGGMDDGSAGLWTIKQWGGLAVVQHPSDAAVPAMPQNALEAVKADHIATAAAIGPLLVKLTRETVPRRYQPGSTEIEKTRKEINVALGNNAAENNLMHYGMLSPFTCPECSGVLTALKEDPILRFRCHTGHAYSAKTLLNAIADKTEEDLWVSIRSLRESEMLLNHLGDHLAEENHLNLAAAYFRKAKEVARQAELLEREIQSGPIGKAVAPDEGNGQPGE